MAQKVLLMGLGRAGKSSIQQVVFHKMSPTQTPFLADIDTLTTTMNTSMPTVTFKHAFIHLDVIDFPTALIDAYFSPSATSSNNTLAISHFLSTIASIIFIIDAQDDYMDALSKLFLTLTCAHQLSNHRTSLTPPTITHPVQFNVFIHKTDALSEDAKIDILRDVQTRIQDELQDAGLSALGSTTTDYTTTTTTTATHAHAATGQVGFYLTSIYDYSIYEALSKVIQKLLLQPLLPTVPSPSPSPNPTTIPPSLPALENLLNALCSHSSIEKCFLFDQWTKLYLCTDSSPVDLGGFEVACDMLDFVMDIGFIYGHQHHQHAGGGGGSGVGQEGGVVRVHHSRTMSGESDRSVITSDNVKQVDTFVSSEPLVPSSPPPPTTTTATATAMVGQHSDTLETAPTPCTTSIQLNTGLLLHMRTLPPLPLPNPHHHNHPSSRLALVCYIRGEHWRDKRGWMAVNFDECARGLRELEEFYTRWVA